MRPDLTPVKSVVEFPRLQLCLLMMCSTERKAVIHYFERTDILYHWCVEDSTKKEHCTIDTSVMKEKRGNTAYHTGQWYHLIYSRTKATALGLRRLKFYMLFPTKH